MSGFWFWLHVALFGVAWTATLTTLFIAWATARHKGTKISEELRFIGTAAVELFFGKKA